MTSVQTLALSLLEEGPVPVRELAALTGETRTGMRAELEGLERLGAVRRLAHSVWALAGYVAPVPVVKPAPAGRPTIAASRLCQRCQGRYAQDGGRLCRRCGRDTGAYRDTTREADAARLERHRAAVASLVPSAAVVGAARVVDGVEYEVVFDGRQSLIGPVDGMHSALSGPGCRVALP